MTASIALLGSPRALSRASRVALAIQPKTLALLGYVALAGAPVPRSELAALLFDDTTDPRGALRWHLTRLRAALPPGAGGALRVTRNTVALECETDVARFRELAEACLSSFDPAAAREALALYRGELLAGLAASGSPRFDSWLFVNEQAVHTLFRRLALAFARWAIDNGSPADAVAPLAQLLATDPYVEDAHALRIESLVSAGAMAHASEAYDEYVRVLRTDLHAEPRGEVAELVGRRAAPEGRMPHEGFVALRDVTLHVVEWDGGGLPVLALHGATASGYAYSALGHHLSPEFRLVAPALRGCGFSDKPPRPTTAARHVEDLAELVEVLGLDRPVIIGHSTGGAIATLLAERVAARGLALLDGVVGTPEQLADRFGAASHLLEEQTVPMFDLDAYLAAARASRAPYAPYAEGLAERFFRVNLARLPDGSYRGTAEPTAVRETWESLGRADVRGALGRLRCPVLAVWAARPTPFLKPPDAPYVTREFVEAQRDAARVGSFFAAMQSNHSTLIRDPEPGLVTALRRFLRDIARGDAALTRPA